jgi:hypothetical protein
MISSHAWGKSCSSRKISGQVGRLPRWKVGRWEGGKVGRLEGWKVGRWEGWEGGKVGRLEVERLPRGVVACGGQKPRASLKLACASADATGSES